jgi:hypothetical protein
MKKIIWKSNRMFKMGEGSVVTGLESENFLLKRKKGVEIPQMKAKNIVQWKKSDNKKKK